MTEWYYRYYNNAIIQIKLHFCLHLSIIMANVANDIYHWPIWWINAKSKLANENRQLHDGGVSVSKLRSQGLDPNS